MDRPLTAVLLAGTLRPSPLREALDVPVLCLPMGNEGTVLDAWLTALAEIDGLEDVRIVVNSERDVEAVEACHRAPAAPGRSGPCPRRVRAIAEPASWRGAGGILHDVTGDLPDEAIVLVGEANALPPPSLAPLRAAWRDDTSGLVGVCGADEPAGVYAFARHTFGVVGPIGYHDLKEQLLPALAGRGVAIRTVQLGQRLLRLNERREYLAAVRRSLAPNGKATQAVRCSPHASVSGSAILEGCCIIEDGVLIEDGAVVHETVLLSGATIGGGAVVSQSIVAPLTAVQPRSQVIRQVFRGVPERVVEASATAERRTAVVDGTGVGR
jgi:hypothetical protein